MQSFEYKVVPAPRKAKAQKGVKGTPARFAAAVGDVMNELAADGWEYLRADTLPCEERSGLTSKTTVFQNLLVFRRPLTEARVAPVAVEDAVSADGEPVVVEKPKAEAQADPVVEEDDAKDKADDADPKPKKAAKKSKDLAAE